ncbi:hypothetical protein [Pleomorphovibrio marinus]|uniref:hypothetical protein n=1 Tax=Pleomorphovibrio marinus TaxID=2164132 RepID=UPI000E0AA469|nr:hypothetical protein [Pleomorphovibrio marinus]
MSSKFVFWGLILMLFVMEGFGQRYYEPEVLSTRWERKKMRQEASVADGGYVLFQAGLRRHENAKGKDVFTGGYGEYNGVVGVNYGYRLNNASFETGLGFIWQYHSGTYFIAPAADYMQTFRNYNSVFLPLVLKYDVPTGPSKKFRFGAMGSLNLLLQQTRNTTSQGRGIYYFDYRSERDKFLDYKFNWDGPRVSGFFKAGVYAELQVFKSSFLNVQFSRAISAGPLRTVTYRWEYLNEKGVFNDDITIEGYMVEIAYKLPLNLFTETK